METTPPEPWLDIMNRLEVDARRLLDKTRVPGKDAQTAVEKANHVIWMMRRFVKSCEALYVERVYDLASIIKRAEADPNMTFAELLEGIAAYRGISFHTNGIIQWAKDHGVDPSAFMTEAWKDDIGQTTKEDDE